MNRIESVDVFKLLAIIAVIAIHTEPFHGLLPESPADWKYPGMVINQLARFAVPFFFVISGYFWGRRVRIRGSVRAISAPMARRIALIFVCWSVIYMLPYNIGAMAEYGVSAVIRAARLNAASLLDSPLNLMMQGTKSHLWFLPALLCALAISWPLVARRRHKTLTAIAIILYLTGLLARSYSDTPWGLHWAFDTRNGPFFSTIFFISGYFLADLTPHPRWFARGMMFFFLGFFLHLAEVYSLWRLYGRDPYNQDYVIGTFCMGVGIAVAALANRAFCRNAVLSGLGRYTLGIYAVHHIFVDLLRPLSRFTNSWLWQIGYVILVLLLSLSTVMLLSRNRLTRTIIM
ncbi:MAG: acyltransferase [Desulfocapsaceae bacterium]|nr:acyltransferase [Desulfocapsaceae bacterium]